jgi:hypothetical protein
MTAGVRHAAPRNDVPVAGARGSVIYQIHNAVTERTKG